MFFPSQIPSVIPALSLDPLKTPPAMHDAFPASSSDDDSDPQTTPTRRRFHSDFTTTITSPSGRASPFHTWEWDEPGVASLPDPRRATDLVLEGLGEPEARAARAEFLLALKGEFARRPREYVQMLHALGRKDASGRPDVKAIVHEASLLFRGMRDLTLCFNHILPPGYRLEAFEDYVLVLVFGKGWKQYPDGRREPFSTYSR
ncbi:uncharacterized protein BXZ73DRAFT_98321 [Epithele typhae]|uniref:uncharacterized protein n=1 Tax=Epithele typhae TaxID=378194 RepID=UPI00200786EF|nr:uncharacterized protein BXZ73DRAFT_98321 [Epithele typhae]KAH9941109.1 hypothetical protein BXZ73DRAFT_98321 [Epithele typhae]